ncbi:exported hypothetical protein [Actinacidiphila cocklensis]|uniref:Ricin B lectin domain-containing protein n=2 Tax=Actinacidiphila cocklensis TaxID=887465 RepID=A0A9W4GQH4_9ACTN|nr:exported hypothetical protein [Actinacidiphila cocklensis]
MLAAGISTLAPAADAQAATATYWHFENKYIGKCLTSGLFGSPTASVYMAPCDNSSFFQQWDWRGADGLTNQLQNRNTGQCLEVDTKHAAGNAVFAASCTWKDSQRWAFTAVQSDDGLKGYLTDAELGVDMVYLVLDNDDNVRGDIFDALTSPSYTSWVGWHS